MSSASNRTVNTCSYSDDGNRDGNADEPDLLRAGAYRMEIISVALRRSGTVHSRKKF